MDEPAVEKQTFLCTIKVKGKKFKIFSNKNHRKSFLKVLEDGSISYPTLEEYLNLCEIYNKGIISQIDDKKFKPGKKFQFLPQVVVKREEEIEEDELTEEEPKEFLKKLLIITTLGSAIGITARKGISSSTRQNNYKLQKRIL